MGTEFVTACNQLLVSAINGIYQGILITFLLALGLRLLRRTNAATRHAVWLCTLVLLVFLVVAHGFLDSRLSTLQPGEIARTEATPEQTIESPNLAAMAAADGQPTGLTDYWSAGQTQPLDQDPKSLPLTSTEGLDEMQRRSIASLFSVPPNLSDSNPSIAVEQHAASDAADRPSWFPRLIHRVINPVPLTLALESRAARIAGVIVLGACLTLASVRILVLLMRLHQIRRLKVKSLPASAGMNELLQDLVTQLDVRRNVELKASPAPQSSFLLGFFHPVILLPTDEQMDSREAEQILRHELAHVQRRDDWANLVQHFILAAFPYHPAVWWISRQLSLEREIACDDHVLESSRHPHAYALLLANLAARMQRCPPLLAPGASNNKTQLQQRIDMILDTHRNTSPRLAAKWLAFIASATALFAVAAICAAPRIVLAQSGFVSAAANAPADAAPAEVPVAGPATVTFTPEADSAEAIPPATPSAIAIVSGPKFKPGEPPVVNLPAPAALPAPQAPAPPAAPAALALLPYNPPKPQATILSSADPVPAPRPGRTAQPVQARAAAPSIEARLERLERMVESLLTRDNAVQNPYHLKRSVGDDFDRKEIERIETYAKHQAEVARTHMMEAEQFEEIKELAKRQAALAASQAKRRAADAEKFARTQPKRPTNPDLKDVSKQQLEALRKQLEILEREREKLDRQIEELERRQEQLDDQLDEDQSGDARSDATVERSETKLPTR